MSLKTVSLNKDSWVVMSNLIMIEGKLQKKTFWAKRKLFEKDKFLNFWTWSTRNFIFSNKIKLILILSYLQKKYLYD